LVARLRLERTERSKFKDKGRQKALQPHGRKEDRHLGQDLDPTQYMDNRKKRIQIIRDRNENPTSKI
jgi:hypothetical protein